MSAAILTLNAGSSSVKFALFAGGGDIPAQPEVAGQIDGIGLGGQTRPRLKAKDAAGRVLDDRDLRLAGDGPHRQALAFLVDWLRSHDGGRRIAGVGHRVVHGAEKFSRPLLLDDAAIDTLRSFIPLAPLHQPHNLAGIEAMAAALPGVPQVACFDTAFHRGQPEIAQRFALPRRLTAQGIRRYGFHGLSYEYIADVLQQHLGSRADGRVIVAHLGNGASMCAMKERRSVATTMGFTAVEGLMMGTRSGSLDPGVLLYLMDYGGMDSQALTRLLYRESGLLGVSGISSDMRELLASERPEAREAVDLFCYRIVREIGSLAAALGGLDALVFTGGIGERAAPVRARVCRALGWLGVEIDEDANAAHQRRIATADNAPTQVGNSDLRSATGWTPEGRHSAVDVLVLPTNEEWMIARHTAALVG